MVEVESGTYKISWIFYDVVSVPTRCEGRASLKAGIGRLVPVKREK